MTPVFLSYSRHNALFADALERALVAAGVDVWMDRTALDAGQEWLDLISASISDASVVLVLWSDAAALRPMVAKEIEIALERNRPIVPIILPTTSAPLPEALQRLHSIALDRPELARYVVDRLLQTVASPSLLFSSRRRIGIDLEIPVEELPDATSMPGGLVGKTLVDSLYCQARFVATPGLTLGDWNHCKPKQLPIFLEASRKKDEAENLDLVRNAFCAQSSGSAFCMLHVVGPADSEGNLELPNGASPQWLDFVETTHSATVALIGSGAALLHVFCKCSAALAAGVGWRMERMWDARFYHFDIKRTKSYAPIIDSRDLRRAT